MKQQMALQDSESLGELSSMRETYGSLPSPRNEYEKTVFDNLKDAYDGLRSSVCKGCRTSRRGNIACRYGR